MAKAEERSTSSSGSAPSSGSSSALSPEDAERAAAEFSPLWQLDEAPFQPAVGVPRADVDALSAAPGVPLGPEPGTGSVDIPVETSTEPAAATPSESGLTEADLIPDDSSSQDGIPIDVPRTYHRPISARPRDPVLPTVIVEDASAAPPAVAAASAEAPAAPPAAAVEAFAPAAEPAEPAKPAEPATPAEAAEPPAKQDGRETDPAIGRMRRTKSGRVKLEPPAPAEEYVVPRNRLPAVLGWSALACVALAVGGYFVVASRSHAPPAPEPAVAHGSAASQPVNIPPPPPVEEAPAAAAPAPTPRPEPPQVASPAPPAPAPPPAREPVTTQKHAAAQPAEPAPPPATPRNPRPPRPKGQPSSPAPGSIVRDNPF